MLIRTGQLDATIEAQKAGVELLLSAENICLYDFSDRTDITGDLDNYTDSLHYGPWISSEILQMIRKDEGRLTLENFEAYYDSVRKVYEEHDYTLYKN